MTEPLYDDEERERPRLAASGPIKVRVPAKINLHLGVGETRSDGYHELTTVYHAISLFDEISARRGDTLTLTMEGAFADPISGEREKRVRNTIQLLGDGGVHYENWGPGPEGEMYRTMVIHSTRP